MAKYVKSRAKKRSTLALKTKASANRYSEKATLSQERGVENGK